jgi:nucleoside-diphosphate-sugar epimerase
MIPPRTLRRPRLLIVGCGDVGLRSLALLRARYRVFALTSQPARCAELRAAGAVPVLGDLDQPGSLRRLAGLAPRILHLAPPPATGAQDSRTRALLGALGRRRPRAERRRAAPRSALATTFIVPERAHAPRQYALAYASTSGVYGDCGGALIDETRPVRPANARAVRRVSAEQQLRAAGARGLLRLAIVRIPGIYAAERLPLARLQKGTPALRADDDVFTSHIHAAELAAIMPRALLHGRPQRVYHAVDDTQLRMGDYFDLVADTAGLPRPPRVSRAAAEQMLEPASLSFMRESRRLANRRLKTELKYRLRFPTVADFLRDFWRK